MLQSFFTHRFTPSSPMKTPKKQILFIAVTHFSSFDRFFIVVPALWLNNKKKKNLHRCREIN